MSLIPAEDPGAEHSPMLRLALLVRPCMAWHGLAWPGMAVRSGSGQIWPRLARLARLARTQTDRYPHTPFQAGPCLVPRDASRPLSHGQEETSQPASQPVSQSASPPPDNLHRSSPWTSFETNAMPPKRAPAPAPTLAPAWARERARVSHTPLTPRKPPAPAPTVHATPAARGSRDASRSPARTSVSCAPSTVAPAPISTSLSGGRGQRLTAWQASPRPQSTAGRAPIRKPCPLPSSCWMSCPLPPSHRGPALPSPPGLIHKEGVEARRAEHEGGQEKKE